MPTAAPHPHDIIAVAVSVANSLAAIAEAMAETNRLLVIVANKLDAIEMSVRR